MKRATMALLLLALGCLGQQSLAAEPAKLTFDTYSGYFVSNKFEPDAAESCHGARKTGHVRAR